MVDSRKRRKNATTEGARQVATGPDRGSRQGAIGVESFELRVESRRRLRLQLRRLVGFGMLDHVFYSL